jgi:sphingolipid delta-4 desaturase
LYNLLAQLAVDVLLVQVFGYRPLIYLLLSSFFAGSLHPCAAHFIAEHYLWDGLEQETYSYYGPLNWLAYNVRSSLSSSPFMSHPSTKPQVGYHNEHHDFPSISWTRLPALRALAPEFYNTIPSHPSWPMVTINFIRDKEVGLFARAKRLNKGVKAPATVEVKHAIARCDVEDSASDSGISMCAKRRNASGLSLASDEKDRTYHGF